LADEIQRLDRQWALVSADLNDGRRVHAHNKTFLDATQRVLKERTSDRWTPALGDIARAAGPDIELRVIHVWKNPADPAGRLLRIEGVTTGADRRLIADRFRLQLQEELTRHFRGVEKCVLERCDDDPDSAQAEPEKQRVLFTIVAPVGAPLPTEASTASSQ